MTGKWWPHHHAPQPGQAVLITGCDTGFGNAAALRLAGERWAVYAGCLTEAGAAALAEEGRGRGNGRLVSFVMDVTKPEVCVDVSMQGFNAFQKKSDSKIDPHNTQHNPK